MHRAGLRHLRGLAARVTVGPDPVTRLSGLMSSDFLASRCICSEGSGPTPAPIAPNEAEQSSASSAGAAANHPGTARAAAAAGRLASFVARGSRPGHWLRSSRFWASPVVNRLDSDRLRARRRERDRFDNFAGPRHADGPGACPGIPSEASGGRQPAVRRADGGREDSGLTPAARLSGQTLTSLGSRRLRGRLFRRQVVAEIPADLAELLERPEQRPAARRLVLAQPLHRFPGVVGRRAEMSASSAASAAARTSRSASTPGDGRGHDRPQRRAAIRRVAGRPLRPRRGEPGRQPLRARPRPRGGAGRRAARRTRPGRPGPSRDRPGRSPATADRRPRPAAASPAAGSPAAGRSAATCARRRGASPARPTLASSQSQPAAVASRTATRRAGWRGCSGSNGQERSGVSASTSPASCAGGAAADRAGGDAEQLGPQRRRRPRPAGRPRRRPPRRVGRPRRGRRGRAARRRARRARPGRARRRRAGRTCRPRRRAGCW